MRKLAHIAKRPVLSRRAHGAISGISPQYLAAKETDTIDVKSSAKHNSEMARSFKRMSYEKCANEVWPPAGFDGGIAWPTLLAPITGKH
jgi:hypothetical protein